MFLIHCIPNSYFARLIWNKTTNQSITFRIWSSHSSVYRVFRNVYTMSSVNTYWHFGGTTLLHISNYLPVGKTCSSICCLNSSVILKCYISGLVQKVCKMPDPMSRCRSKVSVKTKIKYAHMHACEHKKTHTKRWHNAHERAKEKRLLKK